MQQLEHKSERTFAGTFQHATHYDTQVSLRRMMAGRAMLEGGGGEEVGEEG